jgi:hypothetical protein
MTEPLDLDRYTGHTAGPWSIGIDSDDERTQVITADGWHLCYVEHDPHYPKAVLIADAPLLLAEVKALRTERDRLREAAGIALGQIEDVHNGCPEKELHEPVAQTIDRLRAALDGGTR